jgi:hypothetical protein
MTVRTPCQPLSRDDDMRFIAERIMHGDCCAVVGLSNVGKSQLLRAWQQPDLVRRYLGASADQVGFVYIDFNLMLEMSEQAFYELILRTVLALLQQVPTEPPILDRVNAAYHGVVEPTNPFQVPLRFNEGIITLCEDWPRRLVLLLDEFDEIFQGIDERAFLNLRALYDRYPDQLSYVVATVRPLGEYRQGVEISEFSELFEHDTCHLSMLNENDALEMLGTWANAEKITLTPDDRAFILDQAGGHPGLLAAVCYVFASTIENGGAASDGRRDYRLLRKRLEDDGTVRSECVKLWNNLPAELQNALVDFLAGQPVDETVLCELQEKGILVQGDGETRRVFGQAFEGLARRQRLLQAPIEPGVRVDVESGQVFVDGRVVPILTDLEYRLMLLLYGQIDKICDKYRVVEAVWGEDYIDDVDDARIEKLVSRLRQKIEADPTNPRYLITVRGRGYRLLSTPTS